MQATFIRSASRVESWACLLSAVSIVCLLLWKPDTPTTRLLWKPDDAAALWFAVAHPNAASRAGAWSVHPGGVSLVLQSFGEPIGLSENGSRLLSLAAYIALICLLQILFKRTRTVGVGKRASSEIASVPAIRDGQLALFLSVSLALSPIVTSTLHTLNEDILVTVAIVAMLLCLDELLVRRSIPLLALFALLAAGVAFGHLYGVFAVSGAVAAFLVSDMASPHRGQISLFRKLGVLFACAIPVTCLLLDDWARGFDRWFHVFGHYWSQSAWSGASGAGVLPFAGICADCTELGSPALFLALPLQLMCISAIGWGIMCLQPAVRLVCLAAVITVASLAMAEAILRSPVVIHQHRAPLYMLLFVGVARGILVMPRIPRAGFSFAVIMLIGLPGVTARVASDTLVPGMPTLRPICDRIREQPSEIPVVIAGSRLFFLLWNEDPDLLSSPVLVYVPQGSVRDRSPACSLVPPQVRRNGCPLSQPELRECLYIQMTGSQMIRCSLQGWSVQSFSSYQHVSHAVGQVFVASLSREP